MDSVNTALIAVVASLSTGAFATWITAWFGRRHTEAQTGLTIAQADKTVAETAEKITSVATALLEQVAETSKWREAQLLGEVRKLEEKVDTLQRAVTVLSEQVRDAGLVPVYPPPSPGRHS